MITHSHMSTFHKISCKEYAKKFNLKKGQLNPHHSKRMTGKGNPIYGKPRPLSTRIKISQIHKDNGTFIGKKNSMYGKTHSRAVKRRLSKFWKGKWKGSKNPFYGKKHSVSTKKRISNIRIEKGIALGVNNPMYGRTHTKKVRLKMSRYLKNLYYKHPEKHINAIMARNYKKQKNKKGGYISKGQVQVYKIIKKYFYKSAKLNYPVRANGTVYFVDVGVPSIRLAIEYDGEYWHRDKPNETIREYRIKKKGWKVIRITERDFLKLKDNKECISYIKARLCPL